MTNPIQFIIDEIAQLVTDDLAVEIPTDNDLWIDVGLPNGLCFPCVRLDGLICLDDKLNRYMVNVKLYSKDTSYVFYGLAEDFRAALTRSDTFFISGYVDRPEADLSCVLYTCTFAI